jgi:hypothetical protein
LEEKNTMSKVPYVVAVIHKDAVEQLPLVVAAYEVPILVAIHGEHKISIDENADLPNGLTEKELVDDEAMEEEYARLEQRYGNHPDTKQPYASFVFRNVDEFADQVGRFEEVQEKQQRAAAKGKGAKGKAAPEPAVVQTSRQVSGTERANHPEE